MSDEPSLKESKLWMSYTFAKEASEVGWAGVGTPKALCYEGREAGAVALVEWPDGQVSILRRAKDNTTLHTTISREALDKIEELRGKMPPEVSLAVGTHLDAAPRKRAKKK